MLWVAAGLGAGIAAGARTLGREVGAGGVTVGTLLPGRSNTPRIDRLGREAAGRGERGGAASASWSPTSWP